MPSPSIPNGCCLDPLFSLEEPRKQPTPKTKSTSSTCKKNFQMKTNSSFFPNTQFTNHESLPSLQNSLTQFKNAYPEYSDTACIDRIRDMEYYHLSVSNQICLDYIGIGLFSHSQLHDQIASTSSPPPQIIDTTFPFFSVSYKSASLKTQLLQGNRGSEFESAMTKSIMKFLKVSEFDYSMVFTANRSSAFKLLAESYPFSSSQKLLTVYDYESEAVEVMTSISEKRGAKIMSAKFVWPRLRINTGELRKTVVRKRKKNHSRGLFVFPLQSRVSGANYSHQWMSLAQENGWHVLLDACALSPKDMDSFGLSIIRPDYIVCSFYKVFGENPTGFASLFVKKTTISVLQESTSSGIVNLAPEATSFCVPEDYSSGTEMDLFRSVWEIRNQDIEKYSSSSFPENSDTEIEQGKGKQREIVNIKIDCRCLDHVDSLGLILISKRTRFLINWLINSLLKLQHPNGEKINPLVKIYGPKVKFDRGPALAFNVYDWKGEKVDPVLVQKLADRSNISLTYGSLHCICFPDTYREEKERVLKKKEIDEKEKGGNKRTKGDCVRVVTIAVGFLANFEDVYRLWAFVSQFLDADFVEKERWRYTALNQKTIEI